MRCSVCGYTDPSPPRCSSCHRPIDGEASTPVALALRGVTRFYGEGPARVDALRGVDFELRRGEIALLMGPSGSGKTTALLIMGLLMRPSQGTVIVNGRDVASMREGRLRDLRLTTLGFVFQHFNLLNALTAAQNVQVPLRLAGVRRRHARERAAVLLEQLGIADRARHRPDALSGGEKQRVSVARALALGPATILADEPTANLDSVAGRLVISELRRAVERDGTSVIVVSHDLRLLDATDRVHRLEDGRLSGGGIDSMGELATTGRAEPS